MGSPPQPTAPSPPRTAAAKTGQRRVCAHCGTTTTSSWRRSADGSLVCNACGLYLRANKRPRPPELLHPGVAPKQRLRAEAKAALHWHQQQLHQGRQPPPPQQQQQPPPRQRQRQPAHRQPSSEPPAARPPALAAGSSASASASPASSTPGLSETSLAEADLGVLDDILPPPEDGVLLKASPLLASPRPSEWVWHTYPNFAGHSGDSRRGQTGVSASAAAAGAAAGAAQQPPPISLPGPYLPIPAAESSGQSARRPPPGIRPRGGDVMMAPAPQVSPTAAPGSGRTRPVAVAGTYLATPVMTASPSWQPWTPVFTPYFGPVSSPPLSGMATSPRMFSALPSAADATAAAPASATVTTSPRVADGAPASGGGGDDDDGGGGGGSTGSSQPVKHEVSSRG